MPARLRLAALLVPLVLAACSEPAPAPRAAPSALREPTRAAAEPITPIPAEGPTLDSLRVALGERLFGDPILSGNGTVSCATCHPLDRGGTDGLPRSAGANGKLAALNTPTVFNVAFNYKLNWNGKFETLEEQLDGPMKNPAVMGSTFAEAVGRLSKHPEYPALFARAYGRLDETALRDALATFERALATPGARFDRFLEGDESALTDEEKKGYALFASHGCQSCHQGRNIGGNLLERFGVMGDYFAERGKVVEADFGRFNVTHEDGDRFVFRVPSLRNVALTAPYFHDGSAKTLEDAVKVMGRYQLGRPLTDDEVHALSAFLKTLTGTRGGKPL